MEIKNYTKSGFIRILLPLFYIALFLVIILLSILTEHFIKDSVINIVFAMIGIALMLVFPVFQIGCSITSMVYQIKALRSNESKQKNITMMVVAILYIVAAIIFSLQILAGMMSV